jgi:large conductance mechanosensitive channel
MKGFFKEFRDFIQRGNVIDMAVGIIIGAAFKDIVDSLVDNILSPILGLFLRDDFNALAFEIFDVKIGYGAFIMAIINFLIMAFILFLIVKAFNKVASLAKKDEEKPVPTTRKCPYCLSDVPIAATKCCHCTSELPAYVAEPEEAKAE